MMKASRSTVNDTVRPPRGFAALGRRISAYTSRLVLSAVVVLAGVAFARQVLQWWRDEAADLHQPPAAAPGLGQPWAAHEVMVGDRSWSIVRQTFEGDAAGASSALLAACHTAAEETAGMPLPPPGPEQRQLLARLAGSEPARQTSGGVRLYALPEGFPMVVGTRSGGPDERPGAGPPPPAPGPAVAIWGIAVPAAPTSWSLYTFRPGEPGAEVEAAAGAQPPLPPGCRRLLQVRAVGGETSIVFTGPAQPDAWRALYDRWAAEAGLQGRGPWRESAGAWHRAYAGAGPQRPAAVDVHFGRDRSGQGLGVILLGP